MVVTLVVIVGLALVLLAILLTFLAMIVVTTVRLMEDFRLLPLVAFTGDRSEEQTGGKQVKSFHLRRV